MGIGLLLPAFGLAETEDKEILNVSYDVSREFYKDYNAAFVKYWREKTGQRVVVKQSHGGSSAQARAVLGGLEADVVTMNQESDIAVLSEKGKLVREDWRLRFPHRSVPSTSTIVFLVRKGNPKHIRDWDDLAKPGIAIVMPNPKTSGNGRYSFLAAWGQVLKRGGTDREARDFIRRFVQNVPVFDTGGRGATTTFAQREIGDALLTFENEVSLIQKELGADRFDVVYPSVSVLTETPVAVVDAVVDKRGTRTIAEAYLEYLYSDEGQELAAKHHYRPSLARIADKYAARFPASTLWSVDDLLGGWKQAINTHFADGGTFDQVYDEIARQRK
ncbi:MAG: sulfate ABC transporter substrate-binding protein [Nitrospira sp.]|nr:sulfate ABC transporter substrate-binding protein [Nitrospira sp.]